MPRDITSSPKASHRHLRCCAALFAATAPLALAAAPQHEGRHAVRPEAGQVATQAPAVDARQAPLRLTHAWVRAMPPGRNSTAAYLTVTNPTDGAITVSGVTASRGDASLHENRRVDGQVQMRALPELLIGPRSDAVLAPGGLHIMLMDLARTPAEGEELELCLTSSSGEACTSAPVLRRPPAGSGGSSTKARSTDGMAGHRH